MPERAILLTFALLLIPAIAKNQTASANQQATPTPAPSPASTPATEPARPSQSHTLLDGTPVKLRLSQTVSSADAKVGQEVPFEVMEDIKVDNVTVLPKGSVAIANVTEAEHKKSMGRGGKLNVNITYARLADQEKVALRATKEGNGGGHVAAMTTAMVATSIVFFPAAPLFLFVHGKDITIPQGTDITAFVEGDMRLDMARFGSAPPETAQTPVTAPAAQVSLVIASVPPGADIEIDGSFAGNTPSTITVPAGTHQVAVKHKGYVDWTKTLTAAGGNIHLDAEMDPQAQTPPPAPTPTPNPAQSAPPPTTQPQ